MDIKTEFNNLKSAKTIKELVTILDYNLLINSSFIILTAIILTPFIALFTGYTSFMTAYILLFGYLGCLTTLISFLCSRYSFTLKNKDYFTSNIVPIFLFMMLIWSVFSTIFSTNPALSLQGTTYRQEGLLMYFAYCGYFGCGYIVAKGKKTHLLIDLNTIVAIILAILMIINSPSINLFFAIEEIDSVFYQKNHAGYYFCLATIASVFGIFKATEKKKHRNLEIALRLLAFGIVCYANIVTDSTGSYLAIIFGILALLFASALFNKDLLKFDFLILIVFVITTVISFFTGKNPLLYVLDIFFDIGKIFKNYKSPEALGAGTGRWILWLGAIDCVAKRPIFGFGPDNLEEAYKAFGIFDTERPHCEPLQFAASLGVPAACFYLTSITTFAVTYFKKKISNPLVIALVCTVGAYFFSSLFGNTMFYTSPFFFLLFGMATSVLKRA